MERWRHTVLQGNDFARCLRLGEKLVVSANERERPESDTISASTLGYYDKGGLLRTTADTPERHKGGDGGEMMVENHSANPVLGVMTTAPQGLHWQLTDTIHAAYYAVRRELGTAFPEHVYVNAMAAALREVGIQCSREVPYEVVFRGVIVGLFRADLVVEDLVLIEAKVAERIIPMHREQAWHYLAASRLKVAVILNFGPKPMTARVELP